MRSLFTIFSKASGIGKLLASSKSNIKAEPFMPYKKDHSQRYNLSFDLLTRVMHSYDLDREIKNKDRFVVAKILSDVQQEVFETDNISLDMSQTLGVVIKDNKSEFDALIAAQVTRDSLQKMMGKEGCYVSTRPLIDRYTVD